MILRLQGLSGVDPQARVDIGDQAIDPSVQIREPRRTRHFDGQNSVDFLDGPSEVVVDDHIIELRRRPQFLSRGGKPPSTHFIRLASPPRQPSDEFIRARGEDEDGYGFGHRSLYLPRALYVDVEE